MKKEKKIFAICDLEEAYVVHLADYLNLKPDLPFRVMAFTSLESLIEYAKGHEIEILLISVDAMNDDVRKMNVRRTIILSDGETPDLEEGDLSIDKYQDSDTIARLVCGFAGQDSARLKDSLGSCALVCVYSPIGRCGKTLFALTLSQTIAQSGKTLYLNLESCSGLEGLLKANWREDLADLIRGHRVQSASEAVQLDQLQAGDQCHRMDAVLRVARPCGRLSDNHSGYRGPDPGHPGASQTEHPCVCSHSSGSRLPFQGFPV